MTPAEYKTQSATQEVNSQGNVNMYVVLKVCIIYFVGDWSNGMIGVSKTFGGSSILSSPVSLSVGSLDFTGFPAFFISWDFLTMSPMMSTRNDS